MASKRLEDQLTQSRGPKMLVFLLRHSLVTNENELATLAGYSGYRRERALICVGARFCSYFGSLDGFNALAWIIGFV